MRHGKSFNHLGRQKPHREAMLSNMACSLIMHKHITTTLAKAKAMRRFVEPLITKAKLDNTHSRRLVFSVLQDKNAVTELFREVSVKIQNRPGGYTRILKIGNRLGDNAEMCVLELVDYNENLLKETVDKKSKTTRRSRSAKKTSDNEGPKTPIAKIPKVTKTIEEEKPLVQDIAPQEVEAIDEEIIVKDDEIISENKEDKEEKE